MNYDDVCSWLGLPPGSWPPDYYTLLGLQLGEADSTRIEHQVQERMFLLRCRQLSHPERVTDAMNLLAKAFTCLTDPVTKKAYDSALMQSRSAVEVAAATETKPLVESVGASATDPLAWLFGPWSTGTNATTPDVPTATVIENWVTAPPPQRLPLDVTTANALPAPEQVNGVASAEPPMPGMAAIAIDALDPMVKLATSPAARQGLGTKRALYERLGCTRDLQRAWSAAGKFLGHDDRKLGKSTEAVELARSLTAVRRRLREFPPLLGNAGQPGFYVVTLASQPRKAIVATFRMLLPSQREMLARDWRDGLRLLNAHRRFIRDELRFLRRTHWFGRAFRAVDTVLSDHPGWLLGAIVLVALAVATWLGLTQ